MFTQIGFGTILLLGYQYVYYREMAVYAPNVSQTALSKSPCQNETKTNDTEETELDNAQSAASRFNLYLNLIGSLLALMTAPLYGALSDKYGRKPFLIVASVATSMRAVTMSIVIAWELPLWWVWIGNAFCALGGDIPGMYIAVMSSIADITSSGNTRTVYFSIANGLFAIVGTIANFTLGFVIENVGYLYPSLFCVVCYVIAIALAVVYFKETLTISSNKKPRTFNFVVRLFVFCRKGGEYQRWMFITLITALLFAALPSLSRTNIETLHQEDQPFCFSSVEISIFQTGLQLNALVAIIAIKLLHRWMSDEGLTVLSLATSLLSFILETLAVTQWQLFMVPALSIFGTMFFSTMRGIMSRLTKPEDQGSLFAGVLAIETVANLLSGTVANLVYENTLSSFKGAVFVFYAGTQLLATVMMLYFMHHKRKSAVLAPQDEEP